MVPAADFDIHYLAVRGVRGKGIGDRLLGLFLLLPFVSRVLKVDDSLTASVCTLGTIAAYFLMAVGQEEWRGPNGTWQVSSFCCVRICTLSTTKDLDHSPIPQVGWIMYLSAALQFNSIITVIIRSQCTKYVDADETGRIFGVVALGQSIVPLVAYPMFGLVYRQVSKTVVCIIK